MPAGGVRNHVPIDGFLLGVSGKWGACGWSVVQLDHDHEMGPMHGMYGTLDAELDVQRTIRRGELTAFLCLLRKAVGPTLLYVDNKGIVYGLWRGEMRCIGPRAKDADLWAMVWEELRRVHQGGLLVVFEDDKAHRSKKELQQMSLFSKVHHC